MRLIPPARVRVIHQLCAFMLGTVALLSMPAHAQQMTIPPQGQGAPMQPMSGQVTMMLFRVVKSGNQECLLTPAGKLLPVPGNNIPSDITTVPIYRDTSNSYWYTNRQGQPIGISPDKVNWAVHYLESQPGANMGMMPQQGMGMGMAPQQSMGYQPPVQQTTIIQQPAQQSSSGSSSGGSGSSAMATGLAAAGGAMMGSMIGESMSGSNYNSGYGSGYGNYYHGMPYGTPMYHEGGNTYYYNNSGNKAYVDANKENQAVVDQWNHQGNWNDRNNWAQNNATTAQTAQNRSNMQNTAQNHSNMQNAAQNQQSSQGRRGRMFNRGDNGGSSSRFGDAQDDSSQGRFGRRFR